MNSTYEFDCDKVRKSDRLNGEIRVGHVTKQCLNGLHGAQKCSLTTLNEVETPRALLLKSDPQPCL